MRNRVCTSKMYTLHEGVHRKCTTCVPPFLITRFLRLAMNAIILCDKWGW